MANSFYYIVVVLPKDFVVMFMGDNKERTMYD